jgi:hypothetical protein
MDLKHFGDCYDIVKRSLLQWLSDFGPWAAHPMFTHEVTEEDAAAFARFLGLSLVSTEVLVQQSDRLKYLAACGSFRSIFLDPDTGVRLHRRQARRSPEFIFADELIDITRSRLNGLVLVFDQSVARGNERQQIRTKLDHFTRHDVGGIGYISQAPFLVLGKSTDLIEQAYSQLLKASALPKDRLLKATPDQQAADFH